MMMGRTARVGGGCMRHATKHACMGPSAHLLQCLPHEPSLLLAPMVFLTHDTAVVEGAAASRRRHAVWVKKARLLSRSTAAVSICIYSHAVQSRCARWAGTGCQALAKRVLARGHLVLRWTLLHCGAWRNARRPRGES
jgi:hypothetical protein